VSEGNRSGLSEDEVKELARKVMAVICQEWPRWRPSLDSSVVYIRLIEEGVDPATTRCTTRSSGSMGGSSLRISAGEAMIKSACTAGCP
jgi:hypothetical protein